MCLLLWTLSIEGHMPLGVIFSDDFIALTSNVTFCRASRFVGKCSPSLRDYSSGGHPGRDFVERSTDVLHC